MIMTSSVRLFPTLLLLACVGALGAALTTQYGFGLKPCVLCIYQRIPYVVAAVLAATALSPRVSVRGKLALIALCGLAFAVDSGIAVFHVGVEHHWWEGLGSLGYFSLFLYRIRQWQMKLEKQTVLENFHSFHRLMTFHSSCIYVVYLSHLLHLF